MRKLNMFQVSVIVWLIVVTTILVADICGAFDEKAVIAEPVPEIVEIEVDIPEVPAMTSVVAEEPEEGESNTYPLLYTDKDAVVLAQMLWGEARGVADLKLSDGRVISGDAQRAACIWTVLNRLDNGSYGDSIVGVVTAPKQFVGYSSKHPVDEELLGLTYDVLNRWNAEQYGETNVGRVLPSDYYWFASGGDGHNYFRNVYRSDNHWEWELEDVYAWTMEE